jgi:NAD(P)-dependent dehydrogenase (short-subunit alcohol dehydrogenase family)
VPLQVRLAGGLWLIFADQAAPDASETSVAEQLCGSIAASQAHCIKVLPGNGFARLAPNTYAIDPGNPADYQRILEVAQQAKYEYRANFQGVMHLWSIQSEDELVADLSRRQIVAVESAFLLAQALAELPTTKRHARFRLFLITRGVQAPFGQESGKLGHPLASALWGLSRSFEIEHPELHPRYFDLDPAPATRQDLLEQIFAHDRDQTQVEPLIALRQGACFVPRLVKATLRSDYGTTSQELPSVRSASDSTLLITGGLGGLGLQVAQWFAAKNQTADEAIPSLALLGRSQPSAEAEAVLEKIRANGTQVRVFSADVSDYGTMAKVLEHIDAEMPPLRGVIHGAGIQDDNLLLKMDQQQFRKVMAAKVQGAWNLHRLTADRPLDLFVLFSSIVSFLHKVGVSNYSAANAFLDGLAHYRRSQGLKAISINWGAWAEVGFLSKIDQATRDLWTTSEGVQPMPSQRGIQLFECLLEQQGSQYGAFAINWSKWVQYFVSNRMVIPPLIADLASLDQKQTSQITRTNRQPKTESFADLLRETPPNERQASLTDYVTGQLAEILGNPEGQLDAQEGFFDMGLDSLLSVEFKTRLQAGLNCNLSPTLVFNYPTIAQLVQYLLSDVLRLTSATDPEEGEAEDTTAVDPQQDETEPVGMDQDYDQEKLLSEIDAMPDELIEAELNR